MDYSFDKQHSYEAIHTFLDSRENFIVLGLCGKTGSGSSTVANILKMPFSELHLPQPSNDMRYDAEDYEYRILHTYAQKHWRAFYLIKSSALITAHIFDSGEEEFYEFFSKLFDGEHKQNHDKKLREVISKFFNNEIEINLANDDFIEYNKYFAGGNPQMPALHEQIALEDPLNASSTANLERGNDGEYLISLKELQGKIKYRYKDDIKNPAVIFGAHELYKLFKEYTKRREKKYGFKNPLWIFILKKFIYDYLPELSKNFWIGLDSIDAERGLRIMALQQLGNNLRINGTPYGDSFDPEAYQTIVLDINNSIKLLNAYLIQLKNFNYDNQGQAINTRAFVVIDSIKNPFESAFLKSRYTNYYLLGIYTEDSVRYDRLLKNQRLPKSYVEAIDIVEQLSEFKKKYNDTKKSEETDISPIVKKIIDTIERKNLYDVLPFILQNVENCLQDADIFINNEQDTDQHILLKKKLIRYVSLIINPGLVLPSNIERCMQIAYAAKLNSGCISRQVGAAITDEQYHLLSIGWNQQPEGQLPCSYRDICSLYHHWSPAAYSDFECDSKDKIQENLKNPVTNILEWENSPLKEQGKLPAYCFKDVYNSITDSNNQVHPRSLHAEEIAFLNLGQYSAKGGVLFTTSSPCELCSKKAKYKGIAKIYYIEPYAGISFKHVISIGPNSSRPQMRLFTGAVGRAYTQLYTPLIPQKDELALWLGAKIDCNLSKNIEKKNSIKSSVEIGIKAKE